MFQSARNTLRFIEDEQRGQWLLVLIVAVLVGFTEAAGAVMILILLRLANGQSDALDLPLIGDLHARFPNASDESLIGGLAVVMAAFFLCRAALLTGQTWLQNRASQEAGALLSKRLFAGYLRMPYVFHLTRNSAESIRNAYQSVAEIVAYLLVPVVTLVSESLVVLAMVVVLFAAAPLPALLAVGALLPLVVGVLRVVQPRLARSGVETQASHEVNLKAIQQSLAGVREIKVLGRERYFEEHFGEHRMALARAQYTRAALTDVPRIGIETALMLLIVGFLGGTVATGGSVQDSLTLLGLFGYAALRILPGLNRILAQLNSLKYSGAAVQDVLADVETIEAEAVRPDSGGAALEFRKQIAVEGVSYRYPGSDRDALQDVELVIARGESIGIVGPTGSGKSTLVDILLGLLTPTRGRVTVDGTDIGERLAGWHRDVGVVPQTVFLLDDTLRHNIALGIPDAEIDEEAVVEAVHLAQLDDFVQQLPDGLDTVVGERGVRISGGQRQRVAIARALYHRSSVLLFDEGTSALDNVTEAELLRALEPLKGARTIVMVAHRLSTVRACDRVVVVRDGRVADVGPYADLAERNVELRQVAM